MNPSRYRSAPLANGVRVEESTVIDAPVERVWTIIRDFNSHEDWHPAIAASEIEDGRPGDAIGCVRAFTLGSGEKLREELLMMCDRTRTFAYRILDSDVPLIGYRARVELRPVTASDRTFWRWQSTFRTPPGREEELRAVVANGVYRAGFEAVRQLCE